MKLSILVAALLGTTLIAGAAQAQTVAALIGDDTIALVDVSEKKAAKPMKVQGLPGKLLGIDLRPADARLYGLVSDGTVVTIDTASGKATQKSKLDTMLPAGVVATVDFNPMADRLRIIGSDGTNLRANVDDGKVTKDGPLKFADSDMHKGTMPRIVAGAYTNSVKGAKETALYDIDATGALVKQAPPNDGVLNSVGMLGLAADHAAFNIVADGNGGNEGCLMVSGGQNCYKILAGVLLVNASRIRRTRNARRPFPGDRGVAEDHHELREMVE